MPLTEIALKTKRISLYSIQNILNIVHILDSGGDKTCQGLHNLRLLRKVIVQGIDSKWEVGLKPFKTV